VNGTDYNRLEININQKGRVFFINLLIKKEKGLSSFPVRQVVLRWIEIISFMLKKRG